MKCPSCGAAELIHDTRDMPYTYKGETTTIPAVRAIFARPAAKSILDAKQGERYSELMLACHQKQVNAADSRPQLHHHRPQKAGFRPARSG